MIRCWAGNSLSSSTVVNCTMYRNSSLNRPLNNSTDGFYRGDPGWMYAVPEPPHMHHSFKAWAMNSEPLATSRCVGAGYSLSTLQSCRLRQDTCIVCRHVQPSRRSYPRQARSGISASGHPLSDPTGSWRFTNSMDRFQGPTSLRGC